MKNIKAMIPGISLCLVIAIPSWLLVRFIQPLEVIGAPVIAIIAGMILTLFLKNKEAFAGGIAFCSKKVLQYAVVLLGFGLNLATVGKVGMTSLPIILSTITISLVTAFVMYKLLKVPSKTATLIGVGSSICGGSAIAATAPVIDADDEEIAQSISVIFLFNVIAALIFPTLGGLLGMSDAGFSLFAGTAVNDTSSVTAAASTWDSIHKTGGIVLENATIVKLTRTLAIIPITLVLTFYKMKKSSASTRNSSRQVDNIKSSSPDRFQANSNKVRNSSASTGNSQTKVSLKKIFPMFILYFVLASVITTLVSSFFSGEALEFANNTFGFLKQLSKFFIVMAMAAIGLNTNIVKLVKTGGKPILLGFTCWVAITAVSIAMQQIIGIW